MRIKRAFSTFAFAGFATLGLAQQSTIIDRVNGLLVGSMTPGPGARSSRDVAGGYRLLYGRSDANVLLSFPKATSWAAFTHVDLRVRNNGASPAVLEFDCASKNGGGWLSSQAVLGSGESLNLSMPLQTSAGLGLRVLPGLTDGAGSQTSSYGNVFPNDVNAFYIWNKTPGFADITVESMALATHPNTSVAFVDAYGQQARINWAGKVTSTADLANAKAAESTSSAYAYAADSYGGMIGPTTYGTSKYFRTKKQGGRWYLVTPLGNRFFSLGVNEIGAQAWTPADLRSSMFTSLTGLRQNYPDAWSNRDGQLGFIPYQINLQRKYGWSWRSQTEAFFVKRLKTWGFNTIGINSWDTLVANQQLASTFGGTIEGDLNRFEIYDGRTMHDVFDSSFLDEVRATCQSRIIETKASNPMNIGIFIDNELPWGDKLSTDFRRRYGIAFAALNAKSTYSHKRLIVLLRGRYPNLGSLNQAWGTTYSSWGALETGNVVLPSAPSAAMLTDFYDFGYLFAQRYFSTVKAALDQLSFKGLYLGCRFTASETTPEALQAAKENCDVISVNVYNAKPSSVVPELKNLNFPVLISEFCFGASDLGRIGMPLYATQTEASRIEAYKQFMADIQTWPTIVGAHWYRWEDFPATGKLDGDNMSMGLVSITDSPYASFTAQTRAATIGLMNYLKNLP